MSLHVCIVVLVCCCAIASCAVLRALNQPVFEWPSEGSADVLDILEESTFGALLIRSPAHGGPIAGRSLTVRRSTIGIVRIGNCSLIDRSSIIVEESVLGSVFVGVSVENSMKWQGADRIVTFRASRLQLRNNTLRMSALQNQLNWDGASAHADPLCGRMVDCIWETVFGPSITVSRCVFVGPSSGLFIEANVFANATDPRAVISVYSVSFDGEGDPSGGALVARDNDIAQAYTICRAVGCSGPHCCLQVSVFLQGLQFSNGHGLAVVDNRLAVAVLFPDPITSEPVFYAIRVELQSARNVSWLVVEGNNVSVFADLRVPVSTGEQLTVWKGVQMELAGPAIDGVALLSLSGNSVRFVAANGARRVNANELTLVMFMVHPRLSAELLVVRNVSVFRASRNRLVTTWGAVRHVGIQIEACGVSLVDNVPIGWTRYRNISRLEVAHNSLEDLRVSDADIPAQTNPGHVRGVRFALFDAQDVGEWVVAHNVVTMAVPPRAASFPGESIGIHFDCMSGCGFGDRAQGVSAVGRLVIEHNVASLAATKLSEGVGIMIWNASRPFGGVIIVRNNTFNVTQRATYPLNILELFNNPQGAYQLFVSEARNQAATGVGLNLRAEGIRAITVTENRATVDGSVGVVVAGVGITSPGVVRSWDSIAITRNVIRVHGVWSVLLQHAVGGIVRQQVKPEYDVGKVEILENDIRVSVKPDTSCGAMLCNGIVWIFGQESSSRNGTSLRIARNIIHVDSNRDGIGGIAVLAASITGGTSMSAISNATLQPPTLLCVLNDAARIADISSVVLADNVVLLKGQWRVQGIAIQLGGNLSFVPGGALVLDNNTVTLEVELMHGLNAALYIGPIDAPMRDDMLFSSALGRVDNRARVVARAASVEVEHLIVLNCSFNLRGSRHAMYVPALRVLRSTRVSASSFAFQDVVGAVTQTHGRLFVESGSTPDPAWFELNYLRPPSAVSLAAPMLFTSVATLGESFDAHGVQIRLALRGPVSGVLWGPSHPLTLAHVELRNTTVLVDTRDAVTESLAVFGFAALRGTASCFVIDTTVEVIVAVPRSTTARVVLVDAAPPTVTLERVSLTARSLPPSELTPVTATLLRYAAAPPATASFAARMVDIDVRVPRSMRPGMRAVSGLNASLDALALNASCIRVDGRPLLAADAAVFFSPFLGRRRVHTAPCPITPEPTRTRTRSPIMHCAAFSVRPLLRWHVGRVRGKRVEVRLALHVEGGTVPTTPPDAKGRVVPPMLPPPGYAQRAEATAFLRNRAWTVTASLDAASAMLRRAARNATVPIVSLTPGIAGVVSAAVTGRLALTLVLQVSSSLPAVVEHRALFAFAPAALECELDADVIRAWPLAEVTLERDDTWADAATVAALRSSGTSAAFVLAVTGNSMQLVARNRAQALGLAADCAFSDAGTLDATLSPFGLGIGDEPGRYQRGALGGNALIGALTFVVLSTAGYLTFRRKMHAWRKKQRQRASCGSGARPSLLHCMYICMLPSHMHVPIIGLIQGTGASASALLRQAASRTDVVGAVLALACTAAFFLWMFHVVFVQLPRAKSVYYVEKLRDEESTSLFEDAQLGLRRLAKAHFPDCADCKPVRRRAARVAPPAAQRAIVRRELPAQCPKLWSALGMDQRHDRRMGPASPSYGP